MEDKIVRTESVLKQRTEVLVNSYVRSVYNWMAVGLAFTGAVAWYTANSEPLLRLIYGNWLVMLALFGGQLALVFSLSGLVQRMSAGTATGLFILYSGLNGLTLSFIFLVYARASIVSTFFICGLTFLAVSIYGWTTKRDLTSFGGFLMMGLFGVIIASVVNIFVASTAMTAVITYVGVLVFVGLTAYDTQKLKYMALTQPADLDGAVVRKGAILGALSLYLDFINLFLMLLRIFGTRRGE
jgi:FtsH-binding integral membrane protein